MHRLSANESRGLALALAGAAIVLAYATVVAPYAEIYSSGRNRVAALNDQLVRFRAVLSSEDVIKQRLAELEGNTNMAANFLDQRTQALASADLQQYIKHAVDEAGGRLVSTQALSSDGDSELVGAIVKVGMRGNSETLHALLYMLEGRQPIIHLDNLQLRGLARAGAVTSTGDMLDIRFDLTGYLRSDARL